MSLELDHIYICVNEGTSGAKRLMEAGLQVATEIEHHDGQGTASQLVYFRNAYLELLWVEDEDLLRAADPSLAARFDARGQRGCPFGLGLRRTLRDESLPFATTSQSPDWIHPGTTLEVVSSTDGSDPEIFVMPHYLGYDKILTYEPQLIRQTDHLLGIQSLTSVTISGPNLPGNSEAMHWLICAGLLRCAPMSEHLITLEFDQHRQGKTVGFGPTLPLTVMY